MSAKLANDSQTLIALFATNGNPDGFVRQEIFILYLSKNN